MVILLMILIKDISNLIIKLTELSETRAVKGETNTPECRLDTGMANYFFEKRP